MHPPAQSFLIIIIIIITIMIILIIINADHNLHLGLVHSEVGRLIS